MIFMFCSCDNNDEKLPGQIIEKICVDHGQSVKFVSNNDIKKEKYLSSIYGVNYFNMPT